MTMLLNPHLTQCPYGCPWEIATSSHTEKQQREDKHATICARRFDSAQAIAELVTDDPMHDRDVEAVIAAIELDASANSGEVDPNRVRLNIPDHVQPQVIGAVYNRLVRQGRLSRVGWTTNTDRRGRNDGKPLAVYSFNFRAAS